jgi:hypothetical protein
VNPINTHINSGHCGQKNRCKSLFDNDAHGHVYCAGGAMADLGNKDSCNGLALASLAPPPCAHSVSQPTRTLICMRACVSACVTRRAALTARPGAQGQ